MVNDEVVAMLVVHVDGIKIATPNEIMDLVVADPNKRFPTKYLGDFTWYMSSEYKRSRQKGTLEMSQAQFIRRLSNVSESQKPAPSPLLRHWTSGT